MMMKDSDFKNYDQGRRLFWKKIDITFLMTFSSFAHVSLPWMFEFLMDILNTAESNDYFKLLEITLLICILYKVCV